MEIFSAFVLAIVVSIDTLASGFAYGAGNVNVRMRHIVIIDAIGSALLGAGLLVGFLVSHLIHTEITKVLSTAILFAMGGYKILTYLVKRAKKPAEKTPSEIKLAETFALAVALSFDNMTVGIGAAIHNASFVFCMAVIVFSIATDFAFFVFGHMLGGKITKKARLDLSWLGGAVLVMLGVLKFWV